MQFAVPGEMNLGTLTPANTSPIDVDYNHMDEEGGILLDTAGAVASIKKLALALEEGQLMWISDLELDYIAVIIKRRDAWVAVPIKATRTDKRSGTK